MTLLKINVYYLCPASMSCNVGNLKRYSFYPQTMQLIMRQKHKAVFGCGISYKPLPQVGDDSNMNNMANFFNPLTAEMLLAFCVKLIVLYWSVRKKQQNKTKKMQIYLKQLWSNDIVTSRYRNWTPRDHWLFVVGINCSPVVSLHNAPRVSHGASP